MESSRYKHLEKGEYPAGIVPGELNLIDIGVNLTHADFAADLDSVLERAQRAGVVHVVVTGCSLEDSAAALALAARHPTLLSATAGVHPHLAGTLAEHQLPELAALLQQPLVRAVGETGLDYHRHYSEPHIQRRVLGWHLELAEQYDMPLFLHEREAGADMLALLRTHRPRRAVLHCFTGERPTLHAYLDLGLWIGITGWLCDERRGTHLLELVGDVPAERLMIETDAPYLLPRDLPEKPRNRRNEPAFLSHVAAAVARARGDDVAALAQQTTCNARAFFGLP
jgi:TatD DNase family protein